MRQQTSLCFMNDSSKENQLLALANINARISHFAKSESAALERDHAAAWAAAGRHRAAKELLNGEVPEGQALERYKYRTQLRLRRGRTFDSRDQYPP
jgi:hypothetical protein